VIDGPPKIVALAVDPHENLVEMSAPLGTGAQPFGPSHTDLGRKHRAGPVPPISNSLVADLDAALMEKIFYIPE